MDNFSNSSPDVLRRIRGILSREIVSVTGDIRDQSAVRDVLASYQISAVVHLAGLKSVSESFDKTAEYIDVNVGGTQSVVSACAELGVGKLVFSSSATVYGIPQYVPIDEQHPTDPCSPYGDTKLAAEEIIRRACASGRLKAISLRYFNPIGAHHSGLIGESPLGLPNNLLPYIVRVADGLSPRLRIFGSDYNTPDGTGIRDYIHVEDLARAHIQALLQLSSDNFVYETFNIGCGTGVSVLELVNAFRAETGLQVPYEFVGRRAGDVAVCVASMNRAVTHLTWTARHNVRQACASAWVYHNKVGRQRLRDSGLC